MKSPLWAADWAVSCIVYGLVAGARTGCCFVSRPSSCLLTRLLGWAGLGQGDAKTNIAAVIFLPPGPRVLVFPRHQTQRQCWWWWSPVFAGHPAPVLRLQSRPWILTVPCIERVPAPAWPRLANLLTLELMPFQTRSRHHRHLFRFPWAADTMYTMRGTKCGHNLISVDCCANKHYCSVTSGNKPRIMVQWWPCWQHPGGTHSAWWRGG